MFKFSQRSLERLEGVHPDLVAVIIEALEHSPIDFGVVEGLRTVERQKVLVDTGMSQTMNSKHLKQPDGWGHAVDLVPYIGPKISYEWKYIFQMAEAIQRTLKADMDLSGYPRIRWGGAWTLIHTPNSLKTPQQLQEGYIQSRKQAGKKPFVDGPHFEILI